MALTKSWLGVVGLLATLSLSVMACSAEIVDPTAEGAADDDDDDGSGSSESGVSVAGRWTLPADVRAAGAGARVTYDGGPAWNPRLCGGGLRSGALRLRAQLDAEFPAITSIQGYSCRANTASPNKMSIHGAGRALDIFIPLSGGAADNTKGDAVANYLVKNANRLQIQYIIWDRTQWSANGSNDRAYTGPNPHIDHVHVEITEEAAGWRRGRRRRAVAARRSAGTWRRRPASKRAATGFGTDATTAHGVERRRATPPAVRATRSERRGLVGTASDSAFSAARATTAFGSEPKTPPPVLAR